MMSRFCIKYFVERACSERDIVFTISVQCMCVHCVCVRLNLSGSQFLHLCINFKTILAHLFSLTSRFAI